MSTKKTSKTQKQIERENFQAYHQDGLPPSNATKRVRANDNKVEDTTKTLNIGLKDIDEAIVYYFNNVIRPSVIQNGNRISVPILYGSPERWASVQKDGFYRDKNGKIMTPLIMFKRDNVEKNRKVGNKMDANDPNNYGIFEKKYTKKNIYDRFSVLSNRIPVKELYGVVIPDYVNITYSCIIFTDYVEQMNKIVESINYASDSYWGNPERFKFRAMIDNYATSVELAKGEDRAVKTSFSISLFGHIIPDSINTELLGTRKYFSKSKILFKTEAINDITVLEARAQTPESEAPVRFFDSYGTVSVTSPATLTLEQIIFLSTSNTAIADTVVSNVATFLGKRFLVPPAGFSIDEDSFNVYVNGVAINPSHVLIQDTGSNITATFNSALIGYSVESTDTVVLTGKLQ